MSGLWIAVMVATFVAVGVAAQLGWELPEMRTVRRVVDRRKVQSGNAPEPTVSAR
jgi:hypothetical protein